LGGLAGKKIDLILKPPEAHTARDEITAGHLNLLERHLFNGSFFHFSSAKQARLNEEGIAPCETTESGKLTVEAPQPAVSKLRVETTLTTPCGFKPHLEELT
jgi:hypothetical protein